MNLLELPNEICTLIFKFLDIKSKLNVYAIYKLRLLFAPCLVSKIDLSRNTLATAKTLRLDLFQDMAVHILELNLSAIKDLTAEELSPFMRRCNNLKTLDVTFTRIYLCDLKEICCDSLKTIGINFFKPYFIKPSVDSNIEISHGPHKDKTWNQISELFLKQKFEKVHFILLELNSIELQLKFMEHLPLTKNLKITLADHCGHCWSIASEKYDPFTDLKVSTYINFRTLCYVFRYFYKTTEQPLHMLRGISNLDYTQIEYMFIMYCEGIIQIYVSPKICKIFDQHCCCNLSINVCSHLLINFKVKGNILFEAWNRNFIVFNDDFFNNLLYNLIDYFPTYVCMHTKLKTSITKAASNWYCLDSCDTYESYDDVLENIPNNITLTDVCRTGFMAEWSSSITQNLNFELFKNITFLSIKEVFLKDDFFVHLFSKCEKLHTLDVSITKWEPNSLGNGCILSLLTNLYRIRLKNLRLNLRDIDYHHIFSSMSNCPTLENIHVCDQDHHNKHNLNSKYVSVFLENCYNLYSLFIEAEMEENIREALESMLTSVAKKLGRGHLVTKVCYYGCDWNPFTDVFNPSPLDITQ